MSGWRIGEDPEGVGKVETINRIICIKKDLKILRFKKETKESKINTAMSKKGKQ